MSRIFIYIYLLMLIFPASACTQVKGTILDQYGSPLAFASVYQENTTRGTVANEIGVYEFNPIHEGEITLVFQYVGYQKKTIRVQYTGKPMEVNVQLDEDPALVEEIVIRANREDPAYAIIRQAIAAKKNHDPWAEQFEADLYVKGLIKILEAPLSIMGNDIRDMNGILDSTRQGIIYLSESQSKYYFKAPDNEKEVMLSTKKSGDNSVFTANQFSMAKVNLYRNFVQLSRAVMSPIADQALSSYEYRMLGVTVDEQGRTLYKIEVMPKYDSSPLMQGVVYIVDSTWNFHSTDLTVSGNNLKIPLFDTIRFKQIYLPISNHQWPLFTQTMYFKGSFLGFTVGGNFTYIFSNYSTEKDLTHLFETKETFAVEDKALNQDSSYWAKNRPIPLTREEEQDYRRKDSLQVIWNSPGYLDSMDRQQNKWQFNDLLFGYTYMNRKKHFSIRYPEPLSFVRFNVVEGWNLSFRPLIQQEDSMPKKWVLAPSIGYGFSDKTWKPSLQFNHYYNPKMLGEWQVEFGKKYDQYDEDHPIQLRSNSWSSLFYKQNFIRLFSKNFLRFLIKQEVTNGVYLQASAEYARRHSLEKNSDYSFFYRDRIYDSNIPVNPAGPQAYQPHGMYSVQFQVRWVPGQTYSSYPNMRVRNPGKWPNLLVENEWGYSPQADKKIFSNLRFRIQDAYVNVRRLGYFSYSLEWAGSMFNKPQYFQDYLHPLGNEWLIPNETRLYSFALLPFYRYSTPDYYTGIHLKHHFNGFIMDKLPLLKKTSWKTLFSANYLFNPLYKHYFETGVGIENIMLGEIPIGSVEYFWSWSTSLSRDRGFILKVFALISS